MCEPPRLHHRHDPTVTKPSPAGLISTAGGLVLSPVRICLLYKVSMIPRSGATKCFSRGARKGTRASSTGRDACPTNSFRAFPGCEPTVSQRDTDLTEMGAAFEIAVGVPGLSEREHAVDHWMHRVYLHRSVHLLEHLARADEDSLQGYALEQHRHRVDLAATGKQPNKTDTSAELYCANRLGERAGAADFDDVIDPHAPGHFEYLRVPVRSGLVIYHAGRALLSQT